MNLNRVQIAGRLTHDPQTGYTNSGTAIADISLAVSRFFKNQAGESIEETDFIDVTAFGRSAEIIQKHLKKGSAVFVEGHLKLEQWQQQDGQKRSRLKVVAESMQFVGPRPQSPTTSTPSAPARQAPAQPQKPVPHDPDLHADPSDIPF